MADQNARECKAATPTVELHVPVTINDRQRAKLLDGVCSLVTRHEIPVERVRIVAPPADVSHATTTPTDTARMRETGKRFTQEPHCCLSDEHEPSLQLDLMDGGGGEFLVLNAQHWAMDNEAEVDALAEKLKAMLRTAQSAESPQQP